MLARGGLSLGDRLKICEELSLLLLCNCWTAKASMELEIGHLRMFVKT